MSSEREQIQRRRRKLHEQMRVLSTLPLMRGSIVERLRKCGKSNCACASEPAARHGGKFLTVQLDGKTRAMHLRPEDEPRVREAIRAYDQLWRIINELTECELADLGRQVRERRRATAKRRRAK